MLHWDFLLEQESACKTWRLLKSPEFSGPIPAEAIADHGLMYLDYEGPVSGQRGSVTRWDSGTFEWISQETENIEIRLSGDRLKGLARWNGRDWRFE